MKKQFASMGKPKSFTFPYDIMMGSIILVYKKTLTYITL